MSVRLKIVLIKANNLGIITYPKLKSNMDVRNVFINCPIPPKLNSKTF